MVSKVTKAVDRIHATEAAMNAAPDESADRKSLVRKHLRLKEKLAAIPGHTVHDLIAKISVLAASVREYGGELCDPRDADIILSLEADALRTI